MKTKFMGLTKLLKICEKVNIDRTNLDLMTFYDLRSSIKKVREQKSTQKQFSAKFCSSSSSSDSSFDYDRLDCSPLKQDRTTLSKKSSVNTNFSKSMIQKKPDLKKSFTTMYQEKKLQKQKIRMLEEKILERKFEAQRLYRCGIWVYI